MTHLPLQLGEYTTASGPVTITRIGKHGKWAFDYQCRKWHVETGEHICNEAWDIIGRVDEPDRPDQNWFFEALDAGMAEPDSGTTITIKWDPDWLKDMADEKAAPIEAELARVTAERDEAVALLRGFTEPGSAVDWALDVSAFLAKIGGK